MPTIKEKLCGLTVDEILRYLAKHHAEIAEGHFSLSRLLIRAHKNTAAQLLAAADAIEQWPRVPAPRGTRRK